MIGDIFEGQVFLPCRLKTFITEDGGYTRKFSVAKKLLALGKALYISVNVEGMGDMVKQVRKIYRRKVVAGVHVFKVVGREKTKKVDDAIFHIDGGETTFRPYVQDELLKVASFIDLQAPVFAEVKFGGKTHKTSNIIGVDPVNQRFETANGSIYQW